MKAIRDNIIYRPLVERVHNGIIIPIDNTKPTKIGEVVSVGNNCKLGLKEGDKIIAMNNYGHSIKFNGETLISVEEEFIIALIDE